MMALEGIRVIEFSHMAGGPYCGMLLADFGADVIIVDPPPGARRRDVREDPGRLTTGRNKRSIVVNLRSEDGLQVLYRLVEGADVFLGEGFPPGRSERLKVDYETLSRINPRLVYCETSGWGKDGPYAQVPGHDMAWVANSGLLSLIRIPDPEAPPAIPVPIIADRVAGGLYPAFAVAVALLARERTGRGQFIDMAMSDGTMSLLTDQATGLNGGAIPVGGQTRTTGSAPFYSVYRTSDNKWIAIACLESYLWENLCRAIGCEDLLPYQEVESKYPEMFERFRAIFKTRTREEWFDHLKEQGCAVSHVYTMDEAANDPHNRHRRMIVELEHPQLGKQVQIGIAPKLSDTPGSVRSLGPGPGKHTDEILREAGYAEAEISRLRQAGSVA